METNGKTGDNRRYGMVRRLKALGRSNKKALLEAF